MKGFLNRTWAHFQAFSKIFLPYHIRFFLIRQGKPQGRRQEIPPPSASLLLAEALAVSALILGGIGLVGAHHNPIQRTVVLSITVVSAGLNGAFDTLVCVVVHIFFLLLIGYGISMSS